MLGAVSLSVLIPTLNEARNIGPCLESVRFSDDVVVVDSLSTDGTALEAKRRGAQVVEFRWDGGFPKKKSWALENVDWKHDWLLVLDADERVPATLGAEMLNVTRQNHHAAYLVGRRFYFMGRWIRHCGYYPSLNLRLFRREGARYERLIDLDTDSGDNEVHEHVLVNGSIGRVRGDLLHFAYPDISTWVEKHNRYSNWEAAVEVEGRRDVLPAGSLGRRRRLREWARRAPLRPSLRFAYSYIWRGGFLDGYPGFALCRLLASYELLCVLKARERRAQRRLDSSA